MGCGIEKGEARKQKLERGETEKAETRKQKLERRGGPAFPTRSESAIAEASVGFGRKAR
jgi:hypothetical protein